MAAAPRPTQASALALPLPLALDALKASVRVDSAEFRRELGWRLPSALESVSASEVRLHLGPFLEQTFRDWAERESREVHEALATLALNAAPAHSRDSEREAHAGSDSRLTHPAFEVSTVMVDASVVASLALGLGALFANALVGGLFLLAAPTLAMLGKGRSERALRRRAAESGLLAVEDAATKLGLELERVIDDFARQMPQVVG